ncbi:alpha-1-antitrypsin homolog [Nematolebias whitei]|uniref:alpha-1-antitrypsin homolog n=1 Tax=Nematolebias whitei TaxID=451745 RepID=UPI001897860E|nr:alpha-1-antitrypsin homolog [Nematolebias whitei]XP_037541654.1 alpha-1-antitrypsin homolog [Nematolebias whitei]
MYRVFASCALAALLLAEVWADPNHGSEQSHEGEIAWRVLSPHNAEFAIALGHHLKSKAAGENMFYSPLGISTALSMLSAGARGDAHTQLFSSLGYSTLDQMQVNEAYKYALLMFNSQENVQLEVGNSVVVRTGFNPLPAFLNDIRRYFMGEVFNVDFKNPAEAKAQINQHIATKTHDKIKDLVKDLDPQMSMMLINWVYFRGQWLNPFNKNLTTKGDFYVDKNTKVEVDMMWATRRFDYYHDYDNHTTVLQLPYRGNTSMMIVLPDEGMIDIVESMINKDSIMEWQNSLFKRNINLSMPKFSISAEASLEGILKQMGITNAFEDTADFSGISEEVKLKVSKVSHKAVLSVDETGTEAAAVTTLEIMPLSLPQTIKVNRPFFVFIMERSTKGILFMGRINNPTLR